MDMKFSVRGVTLDYLNNPDRYTRLVKSQYREVLTYCVKAFLKV